MIICIVNSLQSDDHVDYLHVLFGDGDPVGDRGPVGINQEATTEVSDSPTFGMLDQFNSEAGCCTLVADAVTKTFLKQI